MHRTHVIPDRDIGQETEVFRGFPQSFHANLEGVSRRLPCTFISGHSLLIIQLSKVISSEVAGSNGGNYEDDYHL
jgi:hypothetical protein